MFVDEKSESLIRYLAENEPTYLNGKYIYPVTSLVSSFDPEQDHWDDNHLKPYLTNLLDMGFITSFTFPNCYSVQIETTARLLHFDEYQSAEELHEQIANNKNRPDTGNPSPIKTGIKAVFTFPVKVVLFLGSLVAVIDFFIKYGDILVAYFR